MAGEWRAVAALTSATKLAGILLPASKQQEDTAYMDSRSDSPGEDPAVSYLAAVPGTPVLTRSGTEIGTVEHVLQVPELDLFDGIVIATDWGLRFVDADQIDLITIRYVRSSLDDAEASKLPPPDGPPVFRVNALEDIGPSLHDRLGRMFRRPHWTQEK